MSKIDVFPIKTSVKPRKKLFQLVLIRKVGTDFEVSNGTVKFKGPNRAELLAMMDKWESDMHDELRTAKRTPSRAASVQVTDDIPKVDLPKKVRPKKSIKKPAVKTPKKKRK